MQTGQPDKLSQYYYDAYAIYRRYCTNQYFIVAPEIFYEIPGTYRQHFMANSSYTKVLQDIHECVLARTNPSCISPLNAFSRQHACVLLPYHPGQLPYPARAEMLTLSYRRSDLHGRRQHAAALACAVLVGLHSWKSSKKEALRRTVLL